MCCAVLATQLQDPSASQGQKSRASRQERILVLPRTLSAKLANARLQRAMSAAERGSATQLPVVRLTPMPLTCKALRASSAQL